MREGATSLGLADRLRPSIGAELRAVVLRCLPGVDTQDIATALAVEEYPLFLGGSLEIVDGRQGSLHLGWEQTGRDFGLFGSSTAWNDDFGSDRLAATNYPPWQALLGARLAQARAYAFPEASSDFINTLELIFESTDERAAIWVWTGNKAEALPLDDLVVSLNVGPNNLADMQVVGIAQ